MGKNTTIKQVRKELQLSNDDFAKLLDFKDARSFGNSPKRKNYEACIIEVYERTKKKYSNE